MIILKNGKILQENFILEGHSIIIQGEKIIDIVPNNEIGNYENSNIIDCTDKLISPGFIDIHSDYVENIISPRPTTKMDFNFALKEAERLLVTSGITTMYHSISLFPDTSITRKEVRKSDNVFQLVEEINILDKEPHIIHNRVHLRYDITNINSKDKVKNLISQGKIHLLSFMDHTPGQGQYKDLEVYRETVKSYNEKMTDKDFENDVIERQNRPKLKFEQLIELSKHAKENGVSLASHDDDTLEKLDVVTEFGATISEFPITLEVARKAKEIGMWTVAGAPNLLLGKSHSGNLSALDGILDGSISVISSDYYPSAMLVNLFNVHEKHGISLTDMFNMVTINPARAVGIDDEVGSIDIGKNADLLVIEKKSKYPAIKLAMVDGHIVFQTSYRYDN